ncbi:GH22256 [Drosophila grimshawi]|uniref:GH22256 n=1 Tax=Drosophila grimshawi TaxID=7222 RepID=B4K113_DROGR|nr:GH22256 [Drosophila grimshawi]
MAPSQMDYPHNENENYTHKKFNTGFYKHKKFGKRSSSPKDETPTAQTALFRPYALSENTPRKRRQESEQRQLQQQHQLPPTPPTTPPQTTQQQQQHYLQQPPQPYHLYTPAATPTPIINHQAFAYVLQKQRAVLQMRQLLSINPDANTWPAELRNALYSMLQQ